MSKHAVLPILIALAAAACVTTTSQTPPTPKPAWTSIYTVPLDYMVSCLSQPAGDGFVVGQTPSPQPGVTAISYVPRSAPQAESRYLVSRVPDGTLQVSWQRLGSVGGLDWLDVQARERANRCGGTA